jgi:hypothetical protein
MLPDPFFYESEAVFKLLSVAFGRFAKLMTLEAGQDALDALAVVRAETYEAAKEAGLSKEHLKHFDRIFDKVTLDAGAAFTNVPR